MRYGSAATVRGECGHRGSLVVERPVSATGGLGSVKGGTLNVNWLASSDLNWNWNKSH